ncbi:unnamed protein product [Urochloa humidicola]
MTSTLQGREKGSTIQQAPPVARAPQPAASPGHGQPAKAGHGHGTPSRHLARPARDAAVHAVAIPHASVPASARRRTRPHRRAPARAAARSERGQPRSATPRRRRRCRGRRRRRAPPRPRQPRPPPAPGGGGSGRAAAVLGEHLDPEPLRRRHDARRSTGEKGGGGARVARPCRLQRGDASGLAVQRENKLQI